MREQIAGACAAAYVSEDALQRRYRPHPGAFSTHYSSIVLPDAALAATERSHTSSQNAFTLVIVGTLDNLSKGPDTLIEAMASCVAEGLDLRLIVVGGGRYRPQLEDQARTLGLDGRVHFLGWVTAGEGVRAQLDAADLFVLPSRQEGVSRATIEAMGRALPCISTRVGGTPELLPSEDLVPPNDAETLARKIRDVVTNPVRMTRMSRRNLAKASDYTEKALSIRWTAFYEYVRESTKSWLETGKSWESTPRGTT
jgi:glycosyltransferase involved in cell wall biosynthesis